MTLILAIDQGTTSSRAIAFEVCDDSTLKSVAISQIELTQHFPHSGWVEHDAAEIWTATLQTCREVIRKAGGVNRFAAIGITNQRETAVIWDAATGELLHRAIVWQDRRTADVSARMMTEGHEPQVQAATGLILDPYFSATKYAWLLDAVPSGRETGRRRGEIKLGTIDAWLIWNLTGRKRVHVDRRHQCVSRTALMDLEDASNGATTCAPCSTCRSHGPARASFRLCGALSGETDASPVRPSSAHRRIGGRPASGPGRPWRAKTRRRQDHLWHRRLPGRQCRGGAGRLDAPSAGHAGLSSRRTRVAYALEGSIFSAGSAIQWLRDGVGMISQSRQSEAMAQELPDNGGVYLVPGFTGLGAPWWEPEARGTRSIGLTRDSRARPISFARRWRPWPIRRATCWMPWPSRRRPAAEDAEGGRRRHRQQPSRCSSSPTSVRSTVERPAFQEMTALGAAQAGGPGRRLGARSGGAPRRRGAGPSGLRAWTRPSAKPAAFKDWRRRGEAPPSSPRRTERPESRTATGNANRTDWAAHDRSLFSQDAQTDLFRHARGRSPLPPWTTPSLDALDGGDTSPAMPVR